jgi:hypothetical protein
MKNFTFIICFMATVMMFAGCQKGDTGPQGPEGPAGNANVVSAVYEVSSWTASNNEGIITQTAELNVPEITLNIASNGAVLVFYGGPSTPISSWTALPYTFPSGQNNVSFGYIFSYATGVVDIDFYASDGLNPGIPGTQYFRIVIIDGYALAANPKVDLNSYEAVKKAFNIKDSNQNQHDK